MLLLYGVMPDTLVVMKMASLLEVAVNSVVKVASHFYFTKIGHYFMKSSNSNNNEHSAAIL